MELMEEPTMCDCGSVVELYDMKHLDGELLCQECYESKTRICINCGEVMEDYGYMDEYSNWYCSEGCALEHNGIYWTTITD